MPHYQEPLRRCSAICTLLPGALMLVASAAAAEYSYWAGYEGSGGVQSNRNCPENMGISGFEVKYGHNGVSRLRAACRSFDQNGNWAGSAQYTSWTTYEWGDSNTREDRYTKSANCPSNHVVENMAIQASGRRGNFTHKIHFACNTLSYSQSDAALGFDQGGNADRVSANPDWVGQEKGSKQSATVCSSYRVPIGFSVKVNQVVQAFRFNCGLPKSSTIRPIRRGY